MTKRRAFNPTARRARRKTPVAEAPRGESGLAVEEVLARLAGRYYWLIACLLLVLLAGIMAVGINRPINGLHSWALANGSWAARSHVNYGLGYTKGLVTLAVGDPPPENPKHYLDHPQLSSLLNAAGMAIFGVHDWTIRLLRIISTAVGLLLMLKLLRGLLDEATALLAGLMFVLFPLTGYFGGGGWFFPVTMWAFWRYLVLIGEYRGGPARSRRHLVELALALFLMVQLSWSGFFYAFTIGLHYVLRCIFRRKSLRPSLLVVLIVMPLTSLALDFMVMAAGYDWDIRKIIELYKWRSAKGERDEFMWGQWFAQIWTFARTNFTWPVLLVLFGHCGYLIAGRLAVFYRGEPYRKRTVPLGGLKADRPSAQKVAKTGARTLPLNFPQIWLFLLPGLLLLFVFKGLVWEHQYWQRPFSAFVAVGTALGIMLIANLLRRIHLSVAVLVIPALVALIAVCCGRGLAAYHKVVWQAPTTIKLFQKLNRRIPPAQALLTFKSFLIRQHASKGSFYRPEYAWYLNREMIVANTWARDLKMVVEKKHKISLAKMLEMIEANTLAEIEQQSKTGRFPCYYVPATDQPWGPPPETRQKLRALKPARLNALLNEADDATRRIIMWELQQRNRQRLIEKLKQRYRYEYFGEPRSPGPRGNTPCYIFDLNQPPRQNKQADPVKNGRLILD